jgi:hypothetical protein
MISMVSRRAVKFYRTTMIMNYEFGEVLEYEIPSGI